MSGGIKGNWGPYSNPAPPDEGDVVVDSAVPGLTFPTPGGIPTLTASGPVTLPGVTSSGPVAADDGLAVTGGATTDSLAVSGAATVGGNPVATIPALNLQVFESATVDLTAVQSGIVIVPALPGKQFILCNRTSLQFRTVASSGAVTAGPTSETFNGASVWIPSATFPLTTAFGGVGPGTVTDPATPLVDTAVTINITVGATGTGGFAWTGKFIAVGYYV
jgi:hypothetical protein